MNRPPDLLAALEQLTDTRYTPTPRRVITADEQARIDQAESRAEDRAADMFVDRAQEQAWQNAAEAAMDRRAEL